jgi:hypothetical protein
VFWPLVTINGGEVVDIDDEDRPLGGRRPITKPGGGGGGAAEPIKPDKPEAGDASLRLAIVISEQRLVESKAALREAEAQADTQAVATERVRKLFQAGGAAKEDVAKAEAELELRQVAVKVRGREVELREAELNALKAELEGPKPRPPQK